MTRAKVENNKGIYQRFDRNVLDGCSDNHDDMKQVYLYMNLMMCNLNYLPCHLLILINLQFIERFIERTKPGLHLTNPDPIICKTFEAFSDFQEIFEAILYD